jgi:hypothetical protein
VPISLPEYIDDNGIDKLNLAVENYKTHKGHITRDRLLVDLDRQSGLRHAELANQEADDIHADFSSFRLLDLYQSSEVS